MGHNGSTVLNLALNMDSQVAGASQLNDLLNPYDPTNKGPLEWTDIDKFWIEILETLSDDEKRQLALANRGTVQEKAILKMFFSGGLRRDLAEINSKVVRAIQEKTGTRVVVDSSKNVTRAIALTACTEFDVYFLHLIRDVRGLVHSYNKRLLEQERKRVYFSSTIHWFLKNLFTSMLLNRRTSNVLKVHYEQIVMEPDRFMDRLESFLDESLPQTRAALKGEITIAAEGIGFGGNRVLKNPNIRFLTGKKPSDAIFSSNLYWYSIGWLSMFWGYRRHRGK